MKEIIKNKFELAVIGLLVLFGISYFLFLQKPAILKAVTNCDDGNPYTNDFFDEASEKCVNEKIVFSKIIKPVSVLCGTKERDTIPINNWVGSPTDCSGMLLEKDSNFYTIYGDDIKLNQISAVELKFDLNDPEIKEIVEIKTEIEMVCKSFLSIYTLTEFNEWLPIPDYYFECSQFNLVRKLAEVKPIILGNSAYVLITPGSGNSEGNIDYAVLNVAYYKT